MVKIPEFNIYGQNDPRVGEAIQPRLELRNWSDLEADEKKKALRYILNSGWLENTSKEALQTIGYLNRKFLRRSPGERLNNIQPIPIHRGGGNERERQDAAFTDFKDIFVNEESEELVLLMLTVFADAHINRSYLQLAAKTRAKKKKDSHIDEAFKKFDWLANNLNHIFDQFSVNVQLTRHGLIPKQDEKITEEIYVPTLKILSDPKWKNVSADLAQMFADYLDKDYPEVITKAHSAVHRFLQILVGEEGKSGKGEVGKLFAKAKKEGVIPVDRFTEPIIDVFQSFLASERATKSTAKPALKDTTSSDALLVMNVVMVFLQHCLQNTK